MRDLRVRIGVILALALLPLLIFSIWQSYSDYSRDKALTRNNIDLTARIALTEIASNFDTTKSLLRFTSALVDEGGCRAELHRLTSESPRFDNLIQTDATGRVKCAAKPVRTSQAQSASLVKALNEDEPFHTAILTLPNANGDSQKILVTLYARFSDGKMTGAFAAVEDVDFLLSLLKKSKILDDSELAIIDAEGEILGGEWSGEDLHLAVSHLSGKETETRLSTQDSNGRPLLILQTPVDNVYLAVATDRKNPVSWNSFNPMTYAAIPILAWIFGFGAIWLCTDQLILTHIRKMRRATLEFARGNRTARVGDLNNPPASIYALGQNFDKMADRIVEREATIGESLNEKETLLREIHHRVKNNLQIIISLLNMQERKLTDEQGLGAIVETRSRINAIALVHRGLYESKNLRFVNMQTFLDRLLPELSLALALNDRGISVSNTADCEPMEADTATPVALFIVEALTNAVKHGVSGGGEININIVQQGNVVTVSVSDTGQTLSQDSKPSNGMGTKLMKGFARQLGGKLEKRYKENGYEIALHFTPRDITPDALIMK